MAGSALALLTLGFALNGSLGRGVVRADSPTNREFWSVCVVRLLLVPSTHLIFHAAAYLPSVRAHDNNWAFHLVLILQPAMPCALSVQVKS